MLINPPASVFSSAPASLGREGRAGEGGRRMEMVLGGGGGRKMGCTPDCN